LKFKYNIEIKSKNKISFLKKKSQKFKYNERMQINKMYIKFE